MQVSHSTLKLRKPIRTELSCNGRTSLASCFNKAAKLNFKNMHKMSNKKAQAPYNKPNGKKRDDALATPQEQIAGAPSSKHQMSPEEVAIIQKAVYAMIKNGVAKAKKAPAKVPLSAPISQSANPDSTQPELTTKATVRTIRSSGGGLDAFFGAKPGQTSPQASLNEDFLPSVKPQKPTKTVSKRTNLHASMGIPAIPLTERGARLG